MFTLARMRRLSSTLPFFDVSLTAPASALAAHRL
jgi:hypothetical protein